MSKAKSQWDFSGELFSTEQIRKVLSVSELTGQIRRLLEKQIGSLWVTGEVSNLRAQSSGHLYFTLKDVNAQLSCVLFRSEPVAHRDLLKDGQKVLLQGDLTVYEARGQYQLIVRAVELQGVGALQIAFEKLKQKLQAEGLFATARKRPLPKYPRRIGLVTSPTGAAIRDVLHVIHRRHSGLEIILAPCRVQGDGAAFEIAAAIRLLNEFNARAVRRDAADVAESSVASRQSSIDLILVTRGGGSLEDLWAFNEEIVARAIFDSALPVVSAVGHEIDFTISDFVADFRAATPSAAAEIITQGVVSGRELASDAAARMRRCVRQQFEVRNDALDELRRRLHRVHPRRRFNEWVQRLDDLQTTLLRCTKQGVRQQSVAMRNVVERLRRVRPAQLLKQRRELLQRGRRRLREQLRHQIHNLRMRYSAAQARLLLLGPDQVLSRGYSITLDADTGAVLREAKRVKTGQMLRTRLAKGEVFSNVQKGG